MRRARKKAVRKLRAKPVLVLVLVLSTVVGLEFSPITSLRHVRVEGGQPFDQARIQDVLSELRGIPCLRINPTRVESNVLSLPEVRSATLTRNIFGNGLLRVAYRTPVARFEGSRRLALSNEGVVYAAHELPKDITVLQVPPSVLQPDLTGIGLWESGTVAKLALDVENIQSNQQHRIVITEPGEVNLYIGQGHVVLGDFKDLDRKVQVLRDRLSRKPSELSQVAELNLMAPDNPQLVPKPSGKTQ